VSAVSFACLSDAIDFLAVRLAAGDVDGIADQCSAAEHDAARTSRNLPPPRSYRLHAIRELGRRHRSQSLRSLYAGREFPADLSEFKLGGHAAELGHVHIDFVRAGAAWNLKEIWMCR
jgi:hypothetical protein